MRNKALFVFDSIVLNVIVLLYLFRVGTLRLSEGGGVEWGGLLMLSGIGVLADIAALFATVILMFLLLGNKIAKNYVYVYVIGAIAISASFALKLQVGHSLFNYQANVKPEAIILLSMVITFFYIIDLYKKLGENKESVKAIFVGAKKDQFEKLKSISSSFALAENVDDLVKINKKIDSDLFVLVDLSLEDIKRCMVNLILRECKVLCLHTSSEKKPNISESQLEKWTESHGFILASYEEFLLEYQLRKL